MSTIVPIQDLDPSVSPPNDCTIRAVVTLSWPYSSSTRQYALLLSERDFRLRARGGQIRVKFSGPAARAVAQGKLGIGDEVVLELGAGEWASAAAVHVPGKSVGELHFGRGVQMKVQKDGSEETLVSVADDAVDEVEQEISQVEVTPAKRTSPTTTFRSSIGREPGSAAIYSSPAYMRKAAKFSYLDGISRLFEDEWDNQDLPRKKARTSMGEVKNWKVVDRTPSPEPSSRPTAIVVEEEMLDASQVEETDVNDTVVEGMTALESVTDQGPTVETKSVRSSPTPAPIQPTLRPASPASAAAALSSPLEMLAAEALADRQPQATTNTSTFPELKLVSTSPSPGPVEFEALREQSLDPVTPRLNPLAPAGLPPTTPQMSPLATRNAFMADTTSNQEKDDQPLVEETLPSDELAQRGPLLLTSPNKATESLLDQLKSTTWESEPATEPALPEEEDASVDGLNQWETDDLAEEDAFSDDEADENLSAHENDAELMPEDDAEDVFDADELEGEEPSDDDTNEDLEMQHLPSHRWLEESTTEKDSDVEEPASLEDRMDSETTIMERRRSIDAQTMFKQPNFAPASTLLNAAETPAKAVQQPASNESASEVTPPKRLFFGLDGAVPSTEEAEVATPATKPTDTPKRTPQSARDKVMKRTFHSLFGLKSSPSPEKEDAATFDSTTSVEASIEQIDEHATEPSTTQIGQLIDNGVNNSQSAQVDVAGALGLAAVEPAVFGEASSKNENALSTGAGPHEMHDMMITTNDPPDQMTHDVQGESPQSVASLSAREHSPELINLDSSSDAEHRDDTIEEAGADRPAIQSAVSALTPQKRTGPKGPEMNLTDLVDSGSAESPAPTGREVVAEDPELESVLLDVEEQSNHMEDLVAEPSLSTEDQQEIHAPTSPSADVGILEQEDVLPGRMSKPEQSAPDDLERPSALSSTPHSPTIEAEASTSVDVELPAPSQALLGSANDDLPLSKDSLPKDNFDSLQQSVSHQELDDSLLEPTPVHPVGAMEVQSEAQVVAPPQDNDVEMLDEERRQSDLSQVSFQSQLVPESGIESAPANLERPIIIEDDVQVDVQVDESSRGSPQEEDVEMVDDGRGEAPSSHASIQSKVIHDSIDTQNNSDVPEISSRPTSRDTVEDFSPMVLGSMTQRIADIVSDDSALLRLQELHSNDTDTEIIRPSSEAREDLLMANSIEEDLLEQTPTRSAKVQAVEMELSPAQLHTINPVEITRTVQEQEPTPQATFADEAQELHVATEEVTALQDSTQTSEDISRIETQAIESQLQAELVGDEVLQSPSAPSPYPVAQNDLHDIADVEDEKSHFRLPLSPSATQPAIAEAQLSHESTAQSPMQPTPETSQLQPSAQPQTDPTVPEVPEHTTNVSQVETREQENAESSAIPTDVLRPQSRGKTSTSMPPPEQFLPPQTPAKRSLRSRLSNVPDVISAWFSPKRSSIAAQEPEERAVVETPKAADVDITNTPRTTKRRASGLSTAHAYFTSLASLSQYVNPSSQQAGTVDILAVVTDLTKEPERAKGGPRDYYTICRVTDPSMPTSSDVRVEVFRPWKAVLPAADVGDVVLLRAFVVKSKKRQAYLLSTDTSAWCVWRFAEHSKATTRGGVITRDGEQPVWARRMSHSEVREEVKGPPVEYGMAEKEQARKLRAWWIETHGETHEGAPAEPASKGQDEDAEIVEE